MNPSAVNDFSTAPKNSLYAFFRHLQHSNSVECLEGHGFFRWRTPVPHPWFNGVLVSSPPGANGGVEIEELKAYFSLKNVAGFTWWLEPDVTNQDWASLLQAGGFQQSTNVPGMVASLADLPVLPPTPSGFSIVPVTNLDQLTTWVHIFVPGYGMLEAFITPIQDIFSSLGLDLPYRYYLGFLDGIPVATSTLFLEAGVAGIYNVATLPQARRLGLGAAMTLAPLLEARQMGFTTGVLQSSEMGYSIYQRLGFQQVCVMDHFYWS